MTMAYLHFSQEAPAECACVCKSWRSCGPLGQDRRRPQQAGQCHTRPERAMQLLSVDLLSLVPVRALVLLTHAVALLDLISHCPTTFCTIGSHSRIPRIIWTYLPSSWHFSSIWTTDWVAFDDVMHNIVDDYQGKTNDRRICCKVSRAKTMSVMGPWGKESVSKDPSGQRHIRHVNRIS